MAAVPSRSHAIQGVVLGGRGEAVAITCRIAAKRLRRDAGATGHNFARERDTGERRAAGRRMAWSRSYGQHLPDRGQAATSPTSRRRGQGHFARERDTGERLAAGAARSCPL